MACNDFFVSCDASPRSHAFCLWEVMCHAFGKSHHLPLGSHTQRLRGGISNLTVETLQLPL